MKRFTPPPLARLGAFLLLAVLATPSAAQPTCLISITAHGTEDKSISSFANNVLTVDEGGNWFLELTFKCTGITNTSTHDPTIEITGITVDSSPLWMYDTNKRFRGDIWNRDGFGPTTFGGNDPTGDFSARVKLSGTSVDDNCHDTGAWTQMQFTAKIGNAVTPNTDMATRTITVTARDDDPLTLTLSPGKPWETTIDPWKLPCDRSSS